MLETIKAQHGPISKKKLKNAPMNGENQPLVTNEPVKVQGFEKINDQLRKIYGIYSNFFKKITKRSQHITDWTWEH